ncbi:type II and III secretion system protein [Alphaproteobacteria bacterium]|nr:type II and III secretion system protein [Alphaproteobacteria bacterium]
MDRDAFDLFSTPIDDFLQDINLPYDAAPNAYDNNSEISEKFRKCISISATENMRMREVLTQMATLAGVNIFIARDIEGSISFSAKDRPFLDILRDICSCSNLKYCIKGNSIKIEYDSPTLHTYSIPSLNIQRDTHSSMSIATDIFSDNISGFSETKDAKSGSSQNNGSNSCVTGTTKSDFWTELENTLKAIVGDMEGNYVTIHRQTGLINACTTQEKHDEIQNYLNLLKDASETQVLIEAKILEVRLNDKFKSGINWDIVAGRGVFKRPFGETGEERLFSAGIKGAKRGSLSTIAGFIEEFGSVKTLSSPRITVLNNHSAVFKVAQNEVIYMPEFQRQYSGYKGDSMNTTMLSANIRTIPIGLVMTVQPSIDRKNNTILLSLRPTISKVAKYIKVPVLCQADIRTGYKKEPKKEDNKEAQMHDIPVVDVRELDSVLRLHSGQVAVMGGLMHEKSTNNREGLPGVEDTPLDFISGSREKSTDVTELVIFLRATILSNKSKMHHRADEKVYKKFAHEMRKLEFKNETTAKK